MNENLPKTMQNVSIIYEQNLSNAVGPARFLTFTIKDFLVWWYGYTIPRLLAILKRALLLADDRLSLSLLLKNFFVPWHRDRSPVGYAVGIIVRLLYLPIGFSFALLIISVGIFILVLASLLPILPVIAIILPFVLGVN